MSATKQKHFEIDGKRVTVKSKTIEIAIEYGAIVSIRNIKTGEVFSGDTSSRRKEKLIKANKISLPSLDVRCQLQIINNNKAKLVYGAFKENGKKYTLIYEIEIDSDTQEILLQPILRFAKKIDSFPTVDIPIFNMQSESIILGNGARYVKGDLPETARCNSKINSPSFAVIEGNKGCIAAWTELSLDIHDVWLIHDWGRDEIIIRY